MQLRAKTYSLIPSVPLTTRRHQNLTEMTSFSAQQSAVAWVWVWVERFRQRRALRRLDDRLLDDIGLNRQQANRETSKLFWQE